MFLHLMMVSVLSGGSAEVVRDFREKCADIFANGASPTILHGHQYKQICQTLKKKVYYATLYDTDNKIPVYSAYKFNKAIRCQRKHVWCIEPQVRILLYVHMNVLSFGMFLNSNILLAIKCNHWFIINTHLKD